MPSDFSPHFTRDQLVCLQRLLEAQADATREYLEREAAPESPQLRRNLRDRCEALGRAIQDLERVFLQDPAYGQRARAAAV